MNTTPLRSRTRRGVSALALAAGAVLTAACSEHAPTAPAEAHPRAASLAEAPSEKVIPLPDPNRIGIAAAISYRADLRPGIAEPGTVERSSIGDPALWAYYRFCGNAGDRVEIEVHRTTSAMDPAVSLFFGTTDHSEGLFASGSAQPGMTWITFADDNNGIPHGVGGTFADPRIDLFLPSTGAYTLAVHAFSGTGPGSLVPYEVHADGVRPCFREVDIDVKPGSEVNSIKLNSVGEGRIAVAVLTTPGFSAADVDPATVTLGDESGTDTPVAQRRNGTYMASPEDVDGDGDLDLVLHFERSALIANGDLTSSTGTLVLRGRTADGTAARGEDAVRVIP